MKHLKQVLFERIYAGVLFALLAMSSQVLSVVNDHQEWSLVTGVMLLCMIFWVDKRNRYLLEKLRDEMYFL